MSALQPDQARSMRETAKQGRSAVGSLGQRWEDLHTTAALLAKAADLAHERLDTRVAHFPAMLGGASEWQRELAWQGIEDIDAMMRPGMTALSTLKERGTDTTAPALALWREFYRAREAVISLVDHQAHADPA